MMDEAVVELDETNSSYTFEDKNILLVDDNDVGRKMNNLILEKMGANVETARSGEETLRLLENDQVYDFILLDVHMPGMGGIECAKRIENTPIFMMAENISENERREIRFAGVLECFQKPLDFKSMVREVGSKLQG